MLFKVPDLLLLVVNSSITTKSPSSAKLSLPLHYHHPHLNHYHHTKSPLEQKRYIITICTSTTITNIMILTIIYSQTQSSLKLPTIHPPHPTNPAPTVIVMTFTIIISTTFIIVNTNIIKIIIFSFLPPVLFVHQYRCTTCSYSCCVCPAECFLLLWKPYTSLLSHPSSHNISCW